MARKLRIEEEGGCYHIINRGNYRRWIFEEEGAKAAFESTLFEGCQRARWTLHAFCIMGNHYHAAIETAQGNLSEGMRWMQSTFANRFNRYRKESGHLFQGRFKSLLVEDTQRMAWLCHYIHLNPVRAGLCTVSELSNYRWSSYWYLAEKRKRPAPLRSSTWLEGAGDLKDTKRGWQRYGAYLEWLAADQPAQKEMCFERMSRGWAIGTKEYQKALVEDEKNLKAGLKLTQKEATEARLLAWEGGLEKCLRILGKTFHDAAIDAKSAGWKVGVAALLKRERMCTNVWLGEHLQMGSPFGVSRYVTEMHAGIRKPALDVYRKLAAKIKH